MKFIDALTNVIKTSENEIEVYIGDFLESLGLDNFDFRQDNYQNNTQIIGYVLGDYLSSVAVVAYFLDNTLVAYQEDYNTGIIFISDTQRGFVKTYLTSFINARSIDYNLADEGMLEDEIDDYYYFSSGYQVITETGGFYLDRQVDIHTYSGDNVAISYVETPNDIFGVNVKEIKFPLKVTQ